MSVRPTAPAGVGATGLRDPGARALRTVFFDLGDTLMYVHPDVPTLYRTALLELGVEVACEELAGALHQAEGMYRGALRERREFETSMAEARAFWQEYNALILSALGVDDPSGSRARVLGERFWAPSSWRAFDEVHPVLGELRAAGIQLAVISNFTDALVAVCRTHELDGYFDCLVASATTGAQKPEPSIFREALRRTGATPESSLMVGDNYVADVLGARACGIDAVLVDRSRVGGRGMFDFAPRAGGGGTGGVVLDCPVIGELSELLTLVRG